MHGVTVGLVTCLLVCFDLSFVNGKSPKTDSIHQSRFARQARQIRSRRETRQPYSIGTRCRYSVTLLDFPPYIMNSSIQRGFMYEKITWFVDFTCFGREGSDPEACIMEPIFVKTLDDMTKLIKEKRVDFAFPVQNDARTVLKDEPAVTLIRAFVSSGCSLIVNIKQCQKESREELLTSLTSQWPILACMILLSGISGVVIWLLERRAKNGQFAPSFATGPPEGFWWAVLSLTTVGYGDVTPKSFPGRMFGIIWVLVGAVMMSLFTAAVINAMQAALGGAKCNDIDSKEVGIFPHNTEIQRVAKEFGAKYITFSSLNEMQWNLSEGIIGRVLVDQNTAFHFLDESGLKRNRQIRLIRNIDYPLDYYLAHVSKGILPTPSMSPNDTDDSDTELAEREAQLTDCGLMLKELSVELVAVSKSTAEELLIPAELQTIQLEGLFSTGSEMTTYVLFSLLGTLLALIFIGILCEVYTRCNASVRKEKEVLKQHHGGFRNPSDRKMADMTQFLVDLEESLKDSITVDIQRMKEEMATTITDQDTEMAIPCALTKTDRSVSF